MTELFYQNGKDCTNGHTNPLRYLKGKRCRECALDAKIRNRKSEVEKAYRLRNKVRIKAKLYGLTEKEYSDLIWFQENKCKICKTLFRETKHMHIDHCHETKKVRGLLCINCNNGIGHLRHSPELLRQAALYCEENK